MSSFALIDPEAREAGLRRLSDELSSGAWKRPFSHLLELDPLDLGYQRVVAEAGGPRRSVGAMLGT